MQNFNENMYIKSWEQESLSTINFELENNIVIQSKHNK